MRLGIAASVGARSEALLLSPGTEHLAAAHETTAADEQQASAGAR
jgi:hypothetical protein